MTADVSAPNVPADATVAILWADLSGPQQRLILALIEAARPDNASSQADVHSASGGAAPTASPSPARSQAVAHASTSEPGPVVSLRGRSHSLRAAVR